MKSPAGWCSSGGPGWSTLELGAGLCLLCGSLWSPPQFRDPGPQLADPKELCAMASPVPLLLVLLLHLIPLHLQVQLGPSRCVKGLPPVLHSCVGTPSPTGTQ